MTKQLSVNHVRLITATLAAALLAGCSASAQSPSATQNVAVEAVAAVATPQATVAPVTLSEPSIAPSPVAVATPGAAASVEPTAAAATASVAPVATAAPTAAPSAQPTAAPTVAAKAQFTTVGVTLLDTSIKLDKTSIPFGTVTLNIKNSGSVLHQLIILRTDIPQNQIPASTTQPGTMQEPGLVMQSQTIAVGASSTLTLTLGAGNYVLMCNQPAHYLIGMHTGFAIY
ncbi:MAG TPA: hypothetical protein VEU77_04900 [Candidatus Acidoferrales bacterium]|nr:hypothetical protein [Candidatus Acidoferrales bacterium]